MERVSNIEISYNIYMDKIYIYWTKYKNMDNMRYVLVRKKASKPFNYRDGIVVYDGSGCECIDNSIRNASLYYYRLFIFPDISDEYSYVSDNKCLFRVIAVNKKEWLDYGSILYKKLPRDVRFQDSRINLKDKSKNYPLKRFFSLCAFAFNKINVYDSLELEQVDIENCDEAYLPYHAKWMNQLYDERFGSDINRLILKTMEEAEPYIGTVTGLKYILQRIFKAEVEINYSDKVSIKLYFDNDNRWLSNMKTTDSIMKIILNYCALRSDMEMVFNVVMSDAYDVGKMADYYFHDTIYELSGESYEVQIADDMISSLVDNMVVAEAYTYLDFLMDCLTNSGLVSKNLYSNIYMKIREMDEIKDRIFFKHEDKFRVFVVDNNLDTIKDISHNDAKKEIVDYTIDLLDAFCTDEYTLPIVDYTESNIQSMLKDDYVTQIVEKHEDKLNKLDDMEIVGEYLDYEDFKIIRTRPVSLTCSECVICDTLFTTDI